MRKICIREVFVMLLLINDSFLHNRRVVRSFLQMFTMISAQTLTMTRAVRSLMVNAIASSLRMMIFTIFSMLAWVFRSRVNVSTISFMAMSMGTILMKVMKV